MDSSPQTPAILEALDRVWGCFMTISMVKRDSWYSVGRTLFQTGHTRKNDPASDSNSTPGEKHWLESNPRLIPETFLAPRSLSWLNVTSWHIYQEEQFRECVLR